MGDVKEERGELWGGGGRGGWTTQSLTFKDLTQ